ncbi:hypothetical protein niasHS_001745 [Heterodera schachtii]|uniref:CHK kinase-like domain-containing protein n=1 Tax=Heterodera schachtii TaxID=97005 RepID=A0ABD2KBZ5_HETSC
MQCRRGRKIERTNVEDQLQQPLSVCKQHQPFIHEMLRPQLDSSVPPIGFGKWNSVGGTLAVASDWMKRRCSTKQRNAAAAAVPSAVAAELAETASLESCLARVITMRDEFVQRRQSVGIPWHQQQKIMNGMGGVGASDGRFLNANSPQPSITSAISSEMSPLGAGCQENLQKICGTAVTFEWLFQRLVEKFNCPDEPEPQWIVEKMNEIGDRDLDRTTVLRITFGWENAKLPKSVVLKICERHEDDPPEEAALASELFKRECLTYEWLSKHRRRVAIPRIFVIKKQWSRSCNALLVIEDLSEKAQINELGTGIAIEGVRDLLHVLAQLHALSMVCREEWHRQLDGARLPPFLYQQIGRFAGALITSLSAPGGSCSADLLGTERVRQLLDPLMATTSQLEQLTTESCAELGLPECLVHGNPIGRNVFYDLTIAAQQQQQQHQAVPVAAGGGTAINRNVDDDGIKQQQQQQQAKGGGTTVRALIDWTQAHSGCFGEDLAKAICWNMDGREWTDAEQLLKLLQYYHYQLLKKLQSLDASSELQKAITLEKVQAAYERFVPVSAVTFLLFLPEELSHADSALLERAQQLVEAVTTKWARS